MKGAQRTQNGGTHDVIVNDESSYFMKAYGRELARLDLQHTYLRIIMGGLMAAPVDLSRPHLRILDSGAANGRWLRDLDEIVVGDCELIGIDVEPSFFPPNPGSHIRLIEQSITSTWPSEWQASFDYVHQRATLVGAARSSLPECVANLARLVKPGGLIELMEADLVDDCNNGPAMCQFMQLMSTVFAAVGIPSDFAAGLVQMLEESGVVGVTSEVVTMTYGALNSRRDMVEMSIQTAVGATQGLLEAAQGMRLPIDHLQDLPERLDKELRNTGGRFKQIIVWGYRSKD